MTELSSQTMETTRKWSILYLMKISFRNEGETKAFSGGRKLRALSPAHLKRVTKENFLIRKDMVKKSQDIRKELKTQQKYK